MKKVQVTLDAAALRNLVTARSYTNREGEEVSVKEIKFELVEMKDENKNVVYNHDKFQLVKTHFAAVMQTKEEREAGEPTVYIGEGVTQVWKNDAPSTKAAKVNPLLEDDDDELGF